MDAITKCLRCGDSSLVTATLEQGMAFCLDHDSYHGVRRLGMEAVICRTCGHTEFRVKDPEHALPDEIDPGHTIQEEDF